MPIHDLNYTAPPTVAKFMHSNAFMRGVKGPIGSGKSVGCVIEVLRRCIQMPPMEDGIRRSRWAVIRNTNQQLRDTTLKTWMDWVRPGVFGRWSSQDNMFILKFNDVYAEILFRPLDSPEDTQRVLSLELTGCWINECREVPLEIAVALQGRLRRYPSLKDVPDCWNGLICDTNPPEVDSPWYKVFEKLPIDDDDPTSVMECESFHQPSGLSPEAENIDNLRPNYYENLARGKTKVWVDTYIHGLYSPSMLGKPVYTSSFKPERHISPRPLFIDPELPVGIGFDTGLTPAAVFKQMTPDGRVHVLREASAFDMGMKRFAERHLRPLVRNYFPNNPLVFIGDPAGVRRADSDESTAFKVLKDLFGCKVRAASTNDPDVRIQATEQLLSQYPDGEPMMLIDPSCKRYIEGLRSKYRYLKMRQTGQFAARPDKNDWSHIVEAGQYIDLYFLSGKYDAAEYMQRDNFEPFAHLDQWRPALKAGY